MAEKEVHIVMHDFTRLVDAKQMALALMEDGTQFAFCPSPISISHPMLVNADVDKNT